MDLHRVVVTDRPRSRREKRQPGRDDRRWREGSGPRHDHAARELVLLHSAQVQRDAAARSRELERALVGLDPADPRSPPGGQDRDLVADRELAVDERSRNDCPESRKRERSVDRQARPAAVAAWRGAGEHPLQGGDELLKALPPRRGDL